MANKMNKYVIQSKNLNNGKETDIYSFFDKEVFDLYSKQIFINDQYKPGKIKKNMVILDIGANIGLACLYFKDYARKIYALEPVSSSYEALVKNVKRYPNIETFKFGILDGNGRIKLYANSDASIRKGFRSEIPDTIFGNGDVHEEVEMKSLDSFFEENKIDHIDLLKIDAEISEYLIFQSEGFKKVVDKIDYIIGEAHYYRMYMPEFIPLILKEYGFETKFLPIESYWKRLDFLYEDSSKNKSYTVGLKTIFFAHK